MKNANSTTKTGNVPQSIKRALELWEIYGPRYATNVATYRALLERRRELGIKPLNKLPQIVLQEYPDIPFLKIDSQAEAREYVKKLREHERLQLVHRIEYMVSYDYSYRTISTRVTEFEYQVRHHGERRHGIDPDSISRQSRGRNRRVDDKR